MDDARLVRASKFLSLHLRHRPEAIGLRLDPAGWVDVDDLLDACRRHGLAIDRAGLDEVVGRNNKRRFAFDDSGRRIRAQQGHSVEVDLGLGAAEPPARLYHGTPERNVGAILREGLRRMARHDVHLSADVETARAVGARRGRPVVLAVDSEAMAREGFCFYRSGNGVWLVEAVPPQFLRPIA